MGGGVLRLQNLEVRVVQGCQPPNYPVKQAGQGWRQEKGLQELDGVQIPLQPTHLPAGSSVLIF